MLSSVIYVAVGYHVFHHRNQLRNLTLSNQARDAYCAERKESEKVRAASFIPNPSCYFHRLRFRPNPLNPC